MATSSTAKEKSYISIRWQILIRILIASLIMLSAGYFFFRTSMENNVALIFEKEIFAIADYSSRCIDGDNLETFLTNLSTTSKEYDAVMACFDQVLAFNPRARMVTYTLNSSGQLEVGIDSKVGSEDALAAGEVLSDEKTLSHFGENEEDIQSVKNWMHTGLSEIVFQDSYFQTTHVDGTEDLFFTGYTPIYNSEGQVVSGLIIQDQASEAINQITTVRQNLIIALAIGFLVIGLQATAITGVTTASLRHLSKAAERIGEGDYEHIDLPGSPIARDEVTELTQLLNQMLEKIYTRETKLVEHVQTLEISFNKGKAKDEVDSIVNTDFFMKLQEQAKANRAKRENR